MNNTLFYIDDTPYTLEEHDGGVRLNTIFHHSEIHQLSKEEYLVIVDGETYHVFFHSSNGTYATINNRTFRIKEHSLRDQLAERFLQSADEHAHSVTFNAPMPGLVTKIIIHQGASVNEGDGILVVEAMKMENEIKTLKTGIVKKIFVQEKQTVEKGDPLFTIE